MMAMPTDIDRYQIVDFLGHGGFADVYLAHDPKLNRQVAIKLLHMAALDRAAPNSTKSARERFAQEVETLVALEFDGVVRLYDFGEFEQRPYLVMQYMARGTLAERLAAGGLALSETAVILNRLCTSLDKVHQRGIIHRDLKPQNILFDADGYPYLGDFGIAQLAATNNPTATIGTPSYMAPEQFDDKPLTIQTDIYQLGVILFQMVTGATPFEATTHAALIHKILQQAPPSVHDYVLDLNPQLDDLFQIVLAKDAGSRYGTAISLAEHFSQIIEQPASTQELTPVVAPALVSEPPTDTAQKKQLMIWLGSGLLLLLVLLISAVLLLPQMRSLATRPTGTTTPLQNQVEQQQGVMVILVTATAVAADEPIVAQDELLNIPTSTSDISAETTQILLAESDTVTPTVATATNTPEPTATAFVPGRDTSNVLARRLSGLIVVDGYLDEWPFIPVTSSEHIVYEHPDWDGSDDLLVNWQLTWDVSYLYLGVAVLDDQHVQTETGDRIFRGDSVSLQIDTDLEGDLSDFMSPDDFQIDISPGDFEAILPSATLYRGTDDRGMQALNTNIFVASQKVDFGYLLEAAIPWSTLNMVPVDGKIMGLALNATDDDNPDNDLQELFISNVADRDYNNPSSWGTLTLRDDTATSNVATELPSPTLSPISASNLMIEDFEYADSSLLNDLYWVNSPGNEVNLLLGSQPNVLSGQSSLAVEYMLRIDTGDYVGIERNLSTPMDWSDYSTICFWLHNPSFSGFLIFQFKEQNSESWKYRAPLQPSTTGEICLSLSKESFELNSRGLNNILELENVDNYAFYFGEGGTTSGTVYIDALQLKR